METTDLLFIWFEHLMLIVSHKLWSFVPGFFGLVCSEGSAAGVRIPFLFMPQSYSSVWIYHISLVRSTVIWVSTAGLL